MDHQVTYDVKVWGIRTIKGRRTTYRVRWIVDGQPRSENFPTLALADAFRSDLVSASRRGEAFSLTTGRPVSHRSALGAVGWYDFATQFVDAKWPRVSANNRKNIAKALVPVTVALLRATPNGFEPVAVRAALREWAFNRDRRAAAPAEVAHILRWVQRNTQPMTAWEQPATVSQVINVISTKLDGKPAAASTSLRNRRILHNALEQAVTQGVLPSNPLKGVRVTAAKPSVAVDKRSVMNPVQADALLRWVRQRPRGGVRLHAFFATLYYAGLRPEEAVALRVRDVALPERGWGEILAHTATPEVGRRWTDSGEIHDRRQLKGRAEGDTRPVPCHPELVAILRGHVAAHQLKPADLLFPGERGGVLAGSVFRRVWERARGAVLSADDCASPLARRVYDLRHTCLTTWLNSGVPPAEVASWAGNSVPVLLATYARCISGHNDALRKRIEEATRVDRPEENHDPDGDKPNNRDESGN
jgi:integrase